ncbi:type II secretion system F family protein [Vibrio maerlii]|uniref:type II secretion system F family protein n=1 Tax=Vibrio maerlii TaxID=2231648 RepID=UPI001F142258|nr:type II secretion system F family protein [Vibrio maerlii]
MDNMMTMLSEPRTQLVIFIWLTVVGLCCLLYVFYLQFTRHHTLKLFGLKHKKERSRFSYIENINEKLGSLVSVSTNEINDKFHEAGIYDSRLSKLLLPIKYTLMIGGLAAIVSWGVYVGWSTEMLGVSACIWIAVTLIGPDAYLAIRKTALQRRLSDRLPYLLDLMGVCVQTGMTIESSMAYLADEMLGFDKDIAHMLRKTMNRSQLVGLEKALEELYERVPTPEVRSFTMTLNQSLQYGSSIYDVLTTLATDIREVQMLGLEEQIGKLSAKMSVPLILFIMFPIVILITAPGIMRMMAGG